MAYDAPQPAELKPPSDDQRRAIRHNLDSRSFHNGYGGTIPRRASQYALVGWEVRNLTHARVTWYGPSDCPIWERLTETQRTQLAKRRLTDAKAVQKAHPGNDKDEDSYGAMLKRFAAEAPAPQPAPKVKRERKPRAEKAARNYRWTCPHCAGEGWTTEQGVTPPHDRPDGRACRPSGQTPREAPAPEPQPEPAPQPAPAHEPATRGERAYWADLCLCPNYHDGSPRRMWNALSDAERASWERNPSVRNYGA